jgi:hypothetical protein
MMRMIVLLWWVGNDARMWIDAQLAGNAIVGSPVE